MDEHKEEEDGVEVGERRSDTAHESPGETHDEISGVVGLSAPSVNSGSEQSRTVLALDESRVLDSLPGELGEGVSLDHSSQSLLSESVLLRVGNIKEVVRHSDGHKEEDVVRGGPLVVLRLVVDEEESAVGVGKGNTGHVPEDEHEAKLLKEHVPGGDNQLLTLGARVGVQPVGVQHKHDLGGHVSVHLVLLDGSRERSEEEDEPGESHLEEHLPVDDTGSGVEVGTHEHVVDEVAGHSVLMTHVQGPPVETKGDGDTGEDGDGHDLSESVDQSVHGEHSGDMEHKRKHDGHVERVHGVAVVGQSLVTEVSQGQTVAPDTRQSHVKHSLDAQEDPQHGPSLPGGEAALQPVLPQLVAKLIPRLSSCRPRKQTVVVGGRNVQIPHEQGETSHHGKSTKRSTEIVALVSSILGLGQRRGQLGGVAELLNFALSYGRHC